MTVLLDESSGEIVALAPLSGVVQTGCQLSDLRLQAANVLNYYATVLRQQLQLHDVTIPPALNLQTDSDGQVRVLANHPASQRVETLLKHDASLLSGFKEVEVLHEMIRRAEDSIKPKRLVYPAYWSPHFNLGVTSSGVLVFFTQ
jgi:hypothetical protein